MYEECLGVEKSVGKAEKYYKQLIMNNGGEGNLGSIGLILSYFVIPLFLYLVRFVRLKNLKVADLAKVPLLKAYVAQTLYNLGMIYKKEGNAKAEKFLEKAFDFGYEKAKEQIK
ncbi:hypothetical protein NHP190012_11070 [Helicobacter sp. NHP19-012]|uniref:Beta-lactamase n=1 Tax=Helicobacter gastrofelis TaxID=2849642 RepID=A0ABN6ICV9_9HELI|nr:hypothetical protein NHP190012_11070 [Helicobacter sp. NHP19-012]